MTSQEEEKQRVREGKKSGVIFCIPFYSTTPRLFISQVRIYKGKQQKIATGCGTKCGRSYNHLLKTNYN